MNVPDVIPPVRILSFDPGTTNMGWALSEYDLVSGSFIVYHHGLFKASKVAKKRKDEIECFGQRLISLTVVAEESAKLLLHHQPNYVVTEDTFFNPRTPNAHIALLLCINSVERTMYHAYHDGKLKHDTAKKLHKISPATIKMIASGSGSNIKQSVINAVLADGAIKFNNPKEDLLTLLTEHEADAIAGGYTFAKTNTFIM